MFLDDLATPCLLIEKKRLDHNLARMQARADINGTLLRPHTKTHKSVYLAQLQRGGGAHGITVAKTGEAEVFVKAGFADVRLAYPIVGQDKHERLLALMNQSRISFCVDTPEGARLASDYYAAQGRQAEVLIEIDTGYGRCGVRWDHPETIEFARLVSDLPGLQLVGLLTHAGNAYHGPKAEGETLEQALRRVSTEERDRMLEVAVALQEAGLPEAQPGNLEISIGSTPSMTYFENRTMKGFSITEIRPGNYVFNDLTQVNLGSASLENCALSVLATVVSKHRESGGRERIFLDAGRKVLTSDGAFASDEYGTILYNARTMEPLPHAHITGLSEEHGWVRVPGGATLSVGDRVRVVPNHACVVVNTQRACHVVDGEEVLDTWPVDAQSQVH